MHWQKLKKSKTQTARSHWLIRNYSIFMSSLKFQTIVKNISIISSNVDIKELYGLRVNEDCQQICCTFKVIIVPQLLLSRSTRWYLRQTQWPNLNFLGRNFNSISGTWFIFFEVHWLEQRLKKCIQASLVCSRYV